MRVLITGAGGYLAGHLIDILINEYDNEVIAFDNNWKSTCDTLIPFVDNRRFQFFSGDVTVEDDVKKAYDLEPTHVVQAAAIVGAPACRKYQSLATLVNVEGCWQICRFKPKDVKLVYCNTGSIYAPGAGICTENSPIDPKSHYAKTKYDGEKIVLGTENTISHRYATAAGVSKTNMRVNLLANDLTIQAINNKTITLFEADFMRTFIHCRDIAKAIYITLSRFEPIYRKQRIYNIGSNDLNFTKRDLVKIIQGKTGCHINFAETEKDPDQRDYGYDSSAFYEFWEPEYTMDGIIDELIKVTPLLSPWDKYR